MNIVYLLKVSKITVYRTKNKIMAQGNYRQHWVRKEFLLLQDEINDFFSQSDQNRSIIQSYNKTFDTNLELDILDKDPVIQSYFQTTSRDPSLKKLHPLNKNLTISNNRSNNTLNN